MLGYDCGIITGAVVKCTDMSAEERLSCSKELKLIKINLVKAMLSPRRVIEEQAVDNVIPIKMELN